MATLHQAPLHHHHHHHPHLLHYHNPRLLHFKIPNSFSFSKKLFFSRNSFLFIKNGYNGVLKTSSSSFGKKHNGVLLHVVNDNGNRLCCFCKACGAEVEATVSADENERAVEDNEIRPDFDINLAVVLAGFAFEAYTTPPENAGNHEVDASNCQAVFLSESFVREIYDGQLFIKLKKGFQFPAMDPWGTSDPYVVMELDSQVVKSKVKWGTKEPTWNEEFSLNIKQPPTKNLQVAAWDANLVTPHKRMGNAEINLGSICDGNMHEVLVELAGMGGGGKIQLEIKYKSFGKIDEEKDRWRIPMVTDFLQKHGFESALKNIVGSESVQARQFVEFAFGQLKSLNDTYLQKNMFSNDTRGRENPDGLIGDSDTFSEPENNLENPPDDIIDTQNGNEQKQINTNLEKKPENTNIVNNIDNRDNSSLMYHVSEASDKHFWKKLAETVNQNVVQRFGLPVPEKIKLDGFELLNKIGLQSRDIADAIYVESGLATSKDRDDISSDEATGLQTTTVDQSSLDIKKVTQDLVKQTDAVLGSLMVLNATVSQFTKGAGLIGKDDNNENAKTNMGGDSKGKTITSLADGVELDEKKAEEMRVLFSKAESAMEAWAMLATSLGQSSFIKSEFEKICFLDNPSTDTQLALWRDSARKRLVVAFRGTEQTKWKDLLTDLMLVPAGLNPERIGGDFKQEVQVHSGFLSAYDSVRTRLITLIKQVVGFTDDGVEPLSKWHVYVTGHSLGGALATLLALELSSSQLARRGAISVTMYNFGSPRVGNKKFAEIYNQKIKDSWRVVNHRDIIPTVPRLMGYFHVAQPVYLAAGDGANALDNVDPMEDGYEGDVIGEATPDVLVSEFMKGEKQLIEKILNTEINIFLAIRDGSALMQHMEDFYYVTLLEHVKSNYQTVPRPQQDEENNL